MRISDWSSDVCSSDLPDSRFARAKLAARAGLGVRGRVVNFGWRSGLVALALGKAGLDQPHQREADSSRRADSDYRAFANDRPGVVAQLVNVFGAQRIVQAGNGVRGRAATVALFGARPFIDPPSGTTEL